MTKAPNEARAKLREAIDARTTARDARDKAKAALANADALLAKMDNDLARLAKASSHAETRGADEVAKAIKSGSKVDIELSRTVTDARHAEADVRSRRGIAKAARDQLAQELAEADAVLDRAERHVNSAAGHVLVTESAPLADKMRAAFAELLRTHDLLVGLDMLPSQFAAGASPALTPALLQAVADARSWDYPLGVMRPQRTIMALAPDAETSVRYRAFLSALTADPDAQLGDIAPPPAPPLPLVRGNAITAPLEAEHGAASHYGAKGERAA